MITVNKNSRLYKIYNALSTVMLFSWVTPKKWDKETDAFRDLCTFLRTTLFYLFISIPSWILFLGGICFTIYQLFVSLFTLQLNSSTETMLFLLASAAGISVLGGIFFVGYVIVDKVYYKATDSNFGELVFEAVKSKHEKICKIIRVVDKG